VGKPVARFNTTDTVAQEDNGNKVPTVTFSRFNGTEEDFDLWGLARQSVAERSVDVVAVAHQLDLVGREAFVASTSTYFPSSIAGSLFTTTVSSVDSDLM
jgi:hypothetical protein